MLYYFFFILCNFSFDSQEYHRKTKYLNSELFEESIVISHFKLKRVSYEKT